MALFKRKEGSDSHYKSSKKERIPLNKEHEVVSNSNGLVPVIIQDAAGSGVIHLGYMDRFALQTSLDTGIVYVYRRSRGKTEKLGKDQRNEFKIRSVMMDRSRRSLLIHVEPAKPSAVASSFIYQIRPAPEEF